MDGQLSYNLNSLQTYNPITKVGIITNKIRHTHMPATAGDAVAIADTDDSEVANTNHPNKIITLGGTIHGSSQADLDNRIDAFKKIFTKRNKDLDIAYGSGTRRYHVMKCNADGIERQDKALFAAFAIELICKPFGRDIAPTVLVDLNGRTAASYTAAVTVGGTAPYQLPIFTININAKTGAGDYIQITHDETAQMMLITGQGFAAGDELIINPENRSVTLNGEDIDYTGTFLELEPEAVAFTITDGFTTRNMDILVEIYQRYV